MEHQWPCGFQRSLEIRDLAPDTLGLPASQTHFAGRVQVKVEVREGDMPLVPECRVWQLHQLCHL